MSWDRPNVNLRILDIIKEQRRDSCEKDPLEIGTCGIYTAHCAFKHGGVASGWSIDKDPSTMYKIFSQSPPRMTDYERLTDGGYIHYSFAYISGLKMKW